MTQPKARIPVFDDLVDLVVQHPVASDTIAGAVIGALGAAAITAGNRLDDTVFTVFGVLLTIVGFGFLLVAVMAAMYRSAERTAREKQ